MTTPPASRSPLLTGLVERLDAADEYVSFVLGPPGEDERDRWVRIGDLTVDSDVIDVVLGATTSVCGGQRDAGAAYLAGWVAELAVAKAFNVMAESGRVWVLDPMQLWIRRHPEGWFDGLAIGDVAVRVLASDAGVDTDGTIECADAAEMERQFAADAVTVLTPVFAAIRARASFGSRGMWGTTADSVVAGAAYHAFRSGQAERDHIERAHRFLDVLADVSGVTFTWPTTLHVECGARPVDVVQKGTCCLWYKVPTPAEDGADGEPEARYCLSCPLVDEAVQIPKWRNWLETEYAHLNRVD